MVGWPPSRACERARAALGAGPWPRRSYCAAVLHGALWSARSQWLLGTDPGVAKKESGLRTQSTRTVSWMAATIAGSALLLAPVAHAFTQQARSASRAGKPYFDSRQPARVAAGLR